MAFEVRPLTADRFEDFADVVNPNRRENHCWCLSHRLPAPQVRALGDTREEAMRALAARDPAPGVVGYDDGEPVAWCSIAPRSALPRLEASRLIPVPEEPDVWSIGCVVVRGGCRRRGHTRRLLEGAVRHAYAEGAGVVEAHPVDNRDEADAPPVRIDTTMAFTGTWSMFRAAGFEVAGTTDAKGSGRPRLVMRHVRQG